MKYELQGDNDFIFEDELNVFKNRGIKKEDIEHYKNPTIEDTIHYSKLENIEEGVKVLLFHLKNKSRIHIVVDADADGYYSSTAMYRYLSKVYPQYLSKITWNIHNGKYHGIYIDELQNNRSGKFDFDLLIVPDAGSNDVEECKLLKENGVDIIILDHHEVDTEDYNAYATVINPQLSPNYSNKQICGVTVVYKFLQALDDELGCDYADEYLDLVGLGTISDMMDSRVLENRYFIVKAIEKQNNNFIKALIKKQSFSIGSKFNNRAVSFYISPLINAVTRVGTEDERKNLFYAMIDDEMTVFYKPRGKDEITVPLYEDMARQCVNIKNRQDRSKKSKTAELVELVDSENVVNVLKVQDKEFQYLKGVLAMSLAQSGKTPVLIYSENGNEISGSGRNIDNYFIKDLKEELTKSELFSMVGGHDNAFGFKTNKTPKEIVDFFNEKYKDLDTKYIYMLDFKVDSNIVDIDLIKKLGKYDDLWGQKFDYPKLLIESVPLKNSEINDTKSMLTLKGKNKIEYKIFYPNQQQIQDLITDKKADFVNIIGSANINEYKNEVYYQVVIDEYEYSDKKIEEEDEDDFLF